MFRLATRNNERPFEVELEAFLNKPSHQAAYNLALSALSSCDKNPATQELHRRLSDAPKAYYLNQLSTLPKHLLACAPDNGKVRQAAQVIIDQLPTIEDNAAKAFQATQLSRVQALQHSAEEAEKLASTIPTLHQAVNGMLDKLTASERKAAALEKQSRADKVARVDADEQNDSLVQVNNGLLARLSQTKAELARVQQEAASLQNQLEGCAPTEQENHEQLTQRTLGTLCLQAHALHTAPQAQGGEVDPADEGAEAEAQETPVNAAAATSETKPVSASIDTKKKRKKKKGKR